MAENEKRRGRSKVDGVMSMEANGRDYSMP